jgi:hypothetical protein
MSALYDPALSGQLLGAVRPAMLSALYGAPDVNGGNSPTGGMHHAMAGYPAIMPPGYAAARPR